MDEARFMVTLGHEHILWAISWREEVDRICMVLPYLPHGDLINWLLDHGRISPPAAKSLAFMMTRALHYLDAKSIVHRDVKPDNILT